MSSTAQGILVVEDSDSVRRQIVGILNLSGFRTRSAESALEAISMARCERPDLILTDVCLPDLDGATAACLLKDVPEFRDIPVVLISALPLDELRERMEDTGAVDSIPKPFMPGQLLACVRRWLAPQAVPATLHSPVGP